MKEFNKIVSKVVLFTLLFIYFTSQHLPAQSRDLKVDILVNQVGYSPESVKKVMMPLEALGSLEIRTLPPELQNWVATLDTLDFYSAAFEIRTLQSNKIVFQDSMYLIEGDFGKYLVGDFSNLDKEGNYYITIANGVIRSYPFAISRNVYEDSMNKILYYFSQQRCGPSTTGFLSPCHIDDAIRSDTKTHQDVTGGWHDASDLRKGLESIITGAIGLVNVLELNPENKDILDELRWGNQYFLKMQEPDGYVMQGMEENRSGNYWTNNIIEKPDGPLRTIMPSGPTRLPLTVYGTSDDRVLNVSPAREIGQFRFIITQAKIARLLKHQDTEYANQCLNAAKRAYTWAMKENIAKDAGQYAAHIEASVALFKATEEESYRNDAITVSKKLLQLQAPVDENSSIDGFFFQTMEKKHPHRVEIEQSGYMAPIMIGLTELINAFPEHDEVSVWKNALALYSGNYVAKMCAKNPFGIMPIGLYHEKQGGDRKVGQYWYRYFMAPSRAWWVGINAHLASTGVGLRKAAQILNDTELAALAQRQIDWILGVNPFNSSTIEGVGYNQPKHFVNSEFRPATPNIIGAVFNGHGGTELDEPYFYNNGEWQVGEYWMPMVAYTLWLMAELNQEITN